MPSERSLYRKVQLVLDIAKSVNVESIGDLAQEVESRELPNFNTLQYDRQRDAFVPRQSQRTIRRLLRLCHRLNLLEEDGRLSDQGRAALRKAKFDDALAVQVGKVLRECGVNIKRLNSTIRHMLKSDPMELPTSSALWEVIEPDLSRAEFSRLLTLLVGCGAAESSQRRLFLNIDLDDRD